MMACDLPSEEEEYQRIFRSNGLNVDDGSLDDLKIQNDTKITACTYANDQKDDEILNAKLYKENSQSIEDNLSEDDLPFKFNLEKTSRQDKESADDTKEEICSSGCFDDVSDTFTKEKYMPDTVSEDDKQFEFHTEEKSTAPETRNDRRCLPDASRHDTVSNSRNKYSTSTYKKMLLFVPALFSLTEGKVEISVPDPPLHFGSNISLSCVCNETGQSPTAWLKGVDRMQLAHRNTSKDINKYSPNIHNGNGVYEYHLTIQNFSITDLDVYRCQFGFNRIEHLSLKGDLFIYLPNKDEIDMKIKNDSDKIIITVNISRIYPSPDYCTIYYEGVALSNQSNSTARSHAGFYKVELETGMTIHRACPGMYEVACRIRTQTFVVLEPEVKSCTFLVKEKNPREWTVITIASIVATIAGIVIVTYRYKIKMKAKRQKCQSSREDVKYSNLLKTETTINKIDIEEIIGVGDRKSTI